MSRTSSNVMRGPYVWHGFDYELQVWVENGKILPCAHQVSMGLECCNQRKYAGLLLEAVRRVHDMLKEDPC